MFRVAKPTAVAFVLAWLALGGAIAAEEQGAAQLAAAEADLSVLSVTFEGKRWTDPAYALRQGTDLLLDEATLKRLGIRHDSAASRTVDGRVLVPLASIPELKWELLDKEQRLILSFDSTRRPLSNIPFGYSTASRPLTPDWGGYVNYGIFSAPTVSDGRIEGATNTLGGSVTASLFGPYGVGTTSALINSQAAANSIGQKAVFLDTNWRWDDLSGLRTLLLGDSIAAPGWWGQAVRFGGVQFSSNYTLQPGFITYPLMAVGGVATAPSTTEILVNDVRIGSQNVPTGPFSITNIPTMSGAGELNLVVRDAFGQQRIISQPFYIAQQLLRPGLTEFSMSVGAERENYGIKNFDYGQTFASGYVRHGLTQVLTGEARFELDNDVAAGGVGADVLIGQLGVLSGGAVFSQADRQTGAKYLLGFDRQGRYLSFGARTTRATSSYSEIGQTLPRVSSASTAFFRTSLGEIGSFGVGYTEQRYFTARPVNLVTATFSRNILSNAYLTLSFTRYVSSIEQTQALAVVTLPLGPLTSATLSGSTTRSADVVHHQAEALVQQSLPVGEGYGYYLRGNTDRLLAGGVSYAGPVGRYTLEASKGSDATALRASATGGIAWVGSHAVLSQPVEQSFAMVLVGDLDGVRVLQENQAAGRTSGGQLALTQIPALNPIKVGIDPTTVPIDVALDGVTKEVVLLPRTGVLVDFRAARERSALVKLVLPSGEPVPVGATVAVEGKVDFAPVGFDGEVYLPGLTDRQTVTVRFNGSACSVVVELEPGARYASLGPLVCDARPAKGTP